MFCPKCGKQLDEGTFFCPNCGTAQQNGDITIPKGTDQQVEITTVNTKSKKKGILLSAIAIVLICVGIFIFVGGADSKVVGKWQEQNTPSVYMTLNKDNTGEISSGGWGVKVNWTYSQSTHTITLNVVGMTSMTATYNPANDTITKNDVIFVRVG